MSVITKLLENSATSGTEFLILDSEGWISADKVDFIAVTWMTSLYGKIDREIAAQRYYFKALKQSNVHGMDLLVFPPSAELATLRAVVPKNQLFDLLMAEKDNYEYTEVSIRLEYESTPHSPQGT